MSYSICPIFLSSLGLSGHQSYSHEATQGLAPHTLKQRKSIHERFVRPQIGPFVAASVSPAHIVETVRKSASAGKTLPKIVLIHLTQLFHHAVGNAVRPDNPCRDVKESAVVGKAEPPKQRIVLNAQELPKFLQALATIPRHYALVVRLILLSGVRVNTLAESKKTEFDLDAWLWRVPHEKRKNRRHTTGPFVIPLPAEAVGWVRELIKLADRDEHLLPVEARRHTDKRNSMSKRTTIGDWLDKMYKAGGGAWRRITPHDLRSTCKSWLSELRVDYETRQRYLDHALEGMDAVYDKADYLERRRAAAEMWLGFLNDLESGKEAAKVIQLHQVA